MRPRAFLGVLLCVAFLSLGTATAVATSASAVSGPMATEEPSIVGVEYAGESAINESGARYLWQDGPHTIEAEIGAGGTSGQYEVCLSGGERPSAAGPNLGCEQVSLSGSDRETVALSFDGFSGNVTGDRTLTVALRNATSDTATSRASIDVTVVTKGGDLDGDGLPNRKEVAEGTDLNESDTDGDGLDDATELRDIGSDPTETHTDGDGLRDGAEAQTHGTSPVKADTDGDGLDDATEIRDLGSNPNKKDTDGDGLHDRAEVKTYDTDPTKADTDDDGLSDGKEVKEYSSDPLDEDSDDDDLTDGDEVHVHGTKPTTKDTDSDGLSDRREVEELESDPTVADTDGDGLDDGPEIKTYDTSPVKADTDGDGFDDGREVDAGTDPTDPSVHPDPGPLRTLLRAGSVHVNGSSILGGITVLLGSVLLVVVATRRSSRLPDMGARLSMPDVSTPTVRSGTDDGDAELPPGAGEPAADDREPDEVASSGDVATGSEDGGSDDLDSQLLTNEEHVRQLLEENDGRLHQSEIVSATDWSKSKVSRVLSRMEEESQVSKIPLGKENLIALPGEEPEAAKPPERPSEDG
jgi:hypothetical protein